MKSKGKFEDIVYIRTSTDEQNPENQLTQILSIKDFVVDPLILEDKISAWKDVDRVNFDYLVSLVNSSRVKNIYCWDLDRLFRNRKKLINFFKLCAVKKVKIHSFRQPWLKDLNSIPSPFNEMMSDLMIQIMGWLAEEESNKKSERVKAAVRKKDGVTISRNGKRWGRKPLPKQTRDRIIEKHLEGFSIRKICDLVFTSDKNGNMKKISKSVVHKTIVDFREENDSI